MAAGFRQCEQREYRMVAAHVIARRGQIAQVRAFDVQ